MDWLAVCYWAQHTEKKTFPSSTFEGISEWIDYVLQFMKLVHNYVYLSGAETMAYLTQSLQREAKGSIEGPHFGILAGQITYLQLEY